ncbi:MAG: hypothetical protein EOO39_07965 [Cytophagaceae bacterium]|nr:MAG: hypothetical protein EOO39_07965 [Cytophagaceae bacterium]
MSHIQLETQSDKYLISLDKASFDREWLVRFVERIRIEELAGQLNLGKEVEDIGEQIKADWWEKNKGRFIND